jgi:dTDP-4-dehydrorhamnose reductase
VGWECRRSLQTLGAVRAIDVADCDLTQPDALRAVLRGFDPDLIVNPAAYTAVDRAESEPELARLINVEAPALMAAEARRAGAAMLHLSTDYVFDGVRSTPYREDDAPKPMSVYGRTKLDGERAVLDSGAATLVLRTSWVYANRAQNFALTMLRLAREREELRVVDDQWGAPTWAGSIAQVISAIVARAGTDRASLAQALTERGGLYHMTAGGRTTWFRFARHIMASVPDPARKLKTLAPIATEQYPTPACRPRFSVLNCDKLHRVWGQRIPDWNEGFALAFDTGAPAA